MTARRRSVPSVGVKVIKARPDPGLHGLTEVARPPSSVVLSQGGGFLQPFPVSDHLPKIVSRVDRVIDSLTKVVLSRLFKSRSGYISINYFEFVCKSVSLFVLPGAFGLVSKVFLVF